MFTKLQPLLQMGIKRKTTIAVLLGGIILMSLPCKSSSQSPSEVMSTRGWLESTRVMWNFFFNKPADTVPAGEIPVRKLTREQLVSAPDNTVFRIGHSCVLIKLDGTFWLTDPMFSDRASPVPFAGPRRFHAPPISIDELPPVKGVIISHDHYDHLDRDSILKMAYKVEHFITPKGVGEIIIGWGVPSSKVQQLDWWQSAEVDGVRVIATPAQHFSGRGLFNKNQTQWASWVVMARHFRLFFSGDSGYFDGFKRIGLIYGPFDLTVIEAGAYNVNWAAVHMMPEETIQAHIDLKGKKLLPIHNGTFDLSMHSWREPFDRMLSLAWEQNIPVALPVMGEPVHSAGADVRESWWSAVDSNSADNQAPVREQHAVSQE